MMSLLDAELTFAGTALAMAAENPFQSAPTPSALIVFRTQSANPLYVPFGADCSRDLMTCGSEGLDQYRSRFHLALHKVRRRRPTHIGRNGDTPHGHTSKRSCGHDSGQ
jgi:hypothetical protein